MNTLIDGYRIFPGEHCGSTAMRGLLKHYCDLELPEPAVFGLGAGVDCVYLEGSVLDPCAIAFGRTATMEVDVARALEIDYRERPESDDDYAWEVVREEVLQGRPTMLSGDILYLDYREFKVHFPGHRFVLLGFDDETEKAFIADRIRDVAEACSYGALAKSRNAPEGFSSFNAWGKFHSNEPGRSLTDACRFAIKETSARMLASKNAPLFEALDGDSMRATSGIGGIRRLADGISEWSKREDAKWIAGYNAQCIEKFGNGGGNFRRLYASFLAWARELDRSLVAADAPGLAAQAAEAWTALATSLFAAAEDPANTGHWDTARRQAEGLAATETDLFERLAAA